MGKILVINGSARPHSVGSAVSSFVESRLQAKGVDVEIVNLGKQKLPFFDAALPPSMDGYEITSPAVQDFSDRVSAADGVVFVVPEYNHAMSGIMKNALDLLYGEWRNKPAAFVGYGWYAAKHSHANFLEVNDVLKLDLGDAFSGMTFKKEIDVDGSLLDTEAVEAMIDATLDELLAKVANA